MRYTLLDTEILIHPYCLKKRRRKERKKKKETNKQRLLQVDPGQNIPEYFSKDIFSKMERLDPRI